MSFEQIVGVVGNGFEVVGITLLTIGAILSLVQYGRALLHGQDSSTAYRGLRRNLGNAILLGLEFLVASDIIHTVGVDTTLVTVATLGLIVLIRTFLSWSLDVEIYGGWPWERARSFGATPDQGTA
jgi:uncharacterized membrane protein